MPHANCTCSSLCCLQCTFTLYPIHLSLCMQWRRRVDHRVKWIGYSIPWERWQCWRKDKYKPRKNSMHIYASKPWERLHYVDAKINISLTRIKCTFTLVCREKDDAMFMKTSLTIVLSKEYRVHIVAILQHVLCD